MTNHLESTRGNPQGSSDSLGIARKKEKLMTPEATFDQAIEILRVADSDNPYSSAVYLEETYHKYGRETLDKARGVFFKSLVGILRAESQEEKRKFIPEYAKSIREIVDASRVIAIWKKAEGKSLTNLEVEDRVREKWKKEMIGFGATEEEAEKWVEISIQTTKTVQMKKGVTDDPPADGLRVVYGIIKDLIREQEATASPK